MPRPQHKEDVLQKYISRRLGDDALVVIDNISTGATCERIAEKSGLFVKDIRRILTKLQMMGLANYTKTKEPESGWYQFHWEFYPDKVIDHIKNNKNDILKNLAEKMDFERDNIFYSCPACSSRLVFEEATERNFLCPKCQQNMIFDDSKKQILELKGEIDMVRTFLKTC